MGSRQLRHLKLFANAHDYVALVQRIVVSAMQIWCLAVHNHWSYSVSSILQLPVNAGAGRCELCSYDVWQCIAIKAMKLGAYVAAC